ncbi:unnamed protein product, partial [Linum tenue]
LAHVLGILVKLPFLLYRTTYYGRIVIIGGGFDAGEGFKRKAPAAASQPLHVAFLLHGRWFQGVEFRHRWWSETKLWLQKIEKLANPNLAAGGLLELELERPEEDENRTTEQGIGFEWPAEQTEQRDEVAFLRFFAFG